jgi:tetratricopeptide (TPR) repeat protein
MPRIKTLTLAMSAVFMMAGCASTQTSVGENGLKMEAVQRVTHGQNNPQAFYQLGRYYHGQTRYDLALEAYRQALSLQPQYVDALTGMGVVHAMLGQYDDALRVLQAAASLDPGSVMAQNNLGYIYWLLNERDEALQAYRQALKLDPLNARARDNLRLAMKEAVNDRAPAAAGSQPSVVPEVAGAAASSAALQEVGPQVHELRAPAPRIEASNERSAAARLSPAPVAVASARIVSDSGLALSEVAPQVYELRMPVQKAERIAALPERNIIAPAERAVVQVATASPVSSAAPDSTAYLTVMNGNGVNGMADRVSRYLAAQGYPSAGIGNQPHFSEAQTRIEYRTGHAEQAHRLSKLLPGQAVLSEVTALDGYAKIRLVLGNDIRHAPPVWDFAGKSNPPAASSSGASGMVNDRPLVVANGNGVKGMARKVADYLSGRGYRTTSVYDMRPFNKAVTRIEYRKGYASQAIQLGDQLPGKVAYVESVGLRTDVRLVLGHDIKHSMAAWSPWLEGVKLAEAKAAARP